jgi:hypothetical protein
MEQPSQRGEWAMRKAVLLTLLAVTVLWCQNLMAWEVGQSLCLIVNKGESGMCGTLEKRSEETTFLFSRWQVRIDEIFGVCQTEGCKFTDERCQVTRVIGGPDGAKEGDLIWASDRCLVKKPKAPKQPKQKDEKQSEKTEPKAADPAPTDPPEPPSK